jgi:hypothetical protein
MDFLNFECLGPGLCVDVSTINITIGHTLASLCKFGTTNPAILSIFRSDRSVLCRKSRPA